MAASTSRRLDQGWGFEKGFDASEQPGEAVGLGDDGGYAQSGGERLAENVLEHRINDHGNDGHSGPKQRSDLDAVHLRHGEIQDNEVGTESNRFFQGFDSVDGFAADFKGRMVLEESADGGPYGNFVFDNEDAFGHQTKGTIARDAPKESRVNTVYPGTGGHPKSAKTEPFERGQKLMQVTLSSRKRGQFARHNLFPFEQYENESMQRC